MAEVEPKIPLAPAPLDLLTALDGDTQKEILRLIPCETDRMQMSLVCKAWVAVVRQAPSKRALPSLVFPKRSPDAARGTHVLCGCHVHGYLDVIPYGARCYGSYHDFWLFLHFPKTRRHELLSLRTGKSHTMPMEMQRQNHDPASQSMVVLAAALSASPDDKACEAMFMAVSWSGAAAAVPPPIGGCVAYWRPGWLRAYEVAAAPDTEDVTYFDGSFHLLYTKGDHIRVYTPLPLQLPLQEGVFRMKEEDRRFSGGRMYNQYIRDRYLVACHEDLLLVVRLIPSLGKATSSFRVFQATNLETPDADGNQWTWSKLDTLGGRMLFLGHGCSRSFKTVEYPGLRDGIYFFDDGKFYDEAMIFSRAGDWSHSYPCSDNGRWCEGSICRRCSPMAGGSRNSPPAWILPKSTGGSI